LFDETTTRSRTYHSFDQSRLKSSNYRFEGEYMRKGIQRLLPLSYVCRSVVAVALCAGYLPAATFAQDGIVAKTPQQSGSQQQPPANPQNPITQPLALSPDPTDARVGVTPGQVQTLSMQDAIAMALKNNLDIASFREGVQISQQNLYSLR